MASRSIGGAHSEVGGVHNITEAATRQARGASSSGLVLAGLSMGLEGSSMLFLFFFIFLIYLPRRASKHIR
jgi:hypothetical protein